VTAASLRLDRDDLILLRETAAYMARRMRDPRDTETLGEIEDRLDQLLLGDAAGRAPLILDRRQGEVLRVALESYAQVLAAPGSDYSNRARVARLGRMGRRLGREFRWYARWLGWLRGA
jgi:hypothetical protein